MLRLKRLYFICCIGFFTLPGVSAFSQGVDINILKSINPQYPSSGFWKSASSSYILVSGTASLGPLVFSLIENDKELRYKSYQMLMGIGINVILTDGMKEIFRRKRPYVRYPNEIFIISLSTGHSFPSGHTSIAFETAASLAINFKKWYIIAPAYIWAGCVGYSRMYLGKHYPTDVFAGAIVGTGSALLSNWATKKLFTQKTSDQAEAPAF